MQKQRDPWHVDSILTRRGRLNRRVFVRTGLPALLLAITLAEGCKQSDAVPPPPSPTVTVARPVERPVVEQDEYTGRLEAVESVEVRARVSGLLVAAPFREGAIVQKGDVLLEIDAHPFQAELDSRQAEEGEARAQVDLATIEFNRINAIPASARTNTEFDKAAAALRQAQAALATAQAAVEPARLNVQWCHVAAPISGRVSSRHVDPGNFITGGSGTGTLLTTIVSVDPMYAYFDVDERTVLRVRELMRDSEAGSAVDSAWPVSLGLATEEGFPHAGKITFVDNQVNPGTGTLRFRGVFSNEDEALRPGLFVRVQVPIAPPCLALLVTDRAIGNDQGRKVLYIVDDKNEVVSRPVQVGALHDGLRAIQDGLKPDDRVIISGLPLIRAGAVVEPKLVAMPGPIAGRQESVVTDQKAEAGTQQSRLRG